jgi:hypothetical protein
MPLSPPAPRAPIHRRAIDCQGYRRDDGLWDLEARLFDTKSYRFANTWRNAVEPGEPLHEMLARLTIDTEYTVVAVECATEHSPHPTCGAIVPNFQRLVGEKLGGGWKKRVKQLVGGAEGCAHHVELLGLMATIAFQTMGPLLAREKSQIAEGKTPGDVSQFLINSCHIWREDGEWASQFRADPHGTLGNRQAPVPEEA